MTNSRRRVAHDKEEEEDEDEMVVDFSLTQFSFEYSSLFICRQNFSSQ